MRPSLSKYSSFKNLLKDAAKTFIHKGICNPHFDNGIRYGVISIFKWGQNSGKSNLVYKYVTLELKPRVQFQCIINFYGSCSLRKLKIVTPILISGFGMGLFPFQSNFKKSLTQICFAFVYEQGFSTYSLSIIHAKPGFHRHDCF